MIAPASNDRWREIILLIRALLKPNKKSKNPHQHIWDIQCDYNDEPRALQPQYASDNEEDDKQIENSNTGFIQYMHKFAAALILEEANPPMAAVMMKL